MVRFGPFVPGLKFRPISKAKAKTKENTEILELRSRMTSEKQMRDSRERVPGAEALARLALLCRD